MVWDMTGIIMILPSNPVCQEDVSLSIRGGTDKVRYYVLANYFSQGGNYKYSNAGEYDSQTKFTRYNFRSNIDININRYLSTRLDLGARITDRNDRVQQPVA